MMLTAIFPGLWELDENRRDEGVDFRNSSSIRIWYNDLTSNYATTFGIMCWRSSSPLTTIIMTLKWKGISYHLRPE